MTHYFDNLSLHEFLSVGRCSTLFSFGNQDYGKVELSKGTVREKFVTSLVFYIFRQLRLYLSQSKSEAFNNLDFFPEGELGDERRDHHEERNDQSRGNSIVH